MNKDMKFYWHAGIESGPDDICWSSALRLTREAAEREARTWARKIPGAVAVVEYWSRENGAAPGSDGVDGCYRIKPNTTKGERA